MRRARATVAAVAFGACGPRTSSAESAAVSAARRPPGRPFVVLSQRSLAIDRLEAPVATPVPVGSQPSAETMWSDAPDIVSPDRSEALLAPPRRDGTDTLAGTGAVLRVRVYAAEAIHMKPARLQLRAGETRIRWILTA